VELGFSLLLDGRIVADSLLPQSIPVDGLDDVVFVANDEPVGARLGTAALGALAGVPLPHLFDEAAERWPHETVDSIHLARWPWELIQLNSDGVRRCTQERCSTRRTARSTSPIVRR
jgi:hypothetical protein